MYFSLSLPFLFIGLTSAAKQGDFGIFEPCITKNGTLRLLCYYTPCSEPTSFTCKLILNGKMVWNASDESCKSYEHGQQNTNVSMNYTCRLTRRKRTEVKNLTIDHTIRKGKKGLKPCVDNTGLLLHQAPTLLWPVILSLWRVLITDS